MFDKLNNLRRMTETGIIAVIRADSPDQALEIVEAVRRGGVEAIEITFTVPGALDVIARLRQAFPGDEILLGAGTVLDSETARAAILAGASFVVSPGFSPEVVRMCNRYQVISMPGCMTVTEIIAAMEAGADVIKFFPGNIFGPSMIKTLKGPLPQAEFVPTGGVNLENVQEWIQSGCIAVGIGGELTKGAKTGDYDSISKTARAFVQKIKAARQ